MFSARAYIDSLRQQLRGMFHNDLFIHLSTSTSNMQVILSICS